MKRIFFFILTNIAVVATVTTLTMVLGLEPYLTANGINYVDLAIYSLLWGMVGSFISLFMSKWIAKSSMGVQIIDERSQYGWLVRRVHDIAKTAGLPKMPEVGIFQSSQPNAFATGPSKSNSLVAVSTGLLQTMNEDEIDGVLAHEIAHIANGDMVTMTLIQGVVNAFVIFISRIIVMLIQRNSDSRGGFASFGIYILCQIVFGFLGSMVTAAFSRAREFRADAGSAKYVGTPKMIAALQALQARFNPKESEVPKSMRAMQIAGGGMMALLSTHPPLEKRIEALQKKGY